MQAAAVVFNIGIVFHLFSGRLTLSVLWMQIGTGSVFDFWFLIFDFSRVDFYLKLIVFFFLFSLSLFFLFLFFFSSLSVFLFWIFEKNKTYFYFYLYRDAQFGECVIFESLGEVGTFLENAHYYALWKSKVICVISGTIIRWYRFAESTVRFLIIFPKINDKRDKRKRRRRDECNFLSFLMMWTMSVFRWSLQSRFRPVSVIHWPMIYDESECAGMFEGWWKNSLSSSFSSCSTCLETAAENPQ